MKKLVLILMVVFALSVNSFASDNEYVIDDNAIENAFSQATEISLQDINLFAEQGLSIMSNTQTAAAMQRSGEVKPWAAFAICWVVGVFGVHRHYMGTSKSMWAYYTFTCGGIFGVVTFVDWIVLLVGAINDDISDYTNNTDFFMWM